MCRYIGELGDIRQTLDLPIISFTGRLGIKTLFCFNYISMCASNFSIVTANLLSCDCFGMSVSYCGYLCAFVGGRVSPSTCVRTPNLGVGTHSLMPVVILIYHIGRFDNIRLESGQEYEVKKWCIMWVKLCLIGQSRSIESLTMVVSYVSIIHTYIC